MFNGRIGAGGYWKAFLLYILISLGLLVLGMALSFLSAFLVATFIPSGNIGAFMFWMLVSTFAGWIPSMLGAIFLSIASIGLQIRRFHDLNLTGWYVGLFWLVGVLTSVFGKTGPGPMDVAPWAIAVSLAGGAIWVAIAFIPGKAEPNRFGLPGVYRSWWTALIGKKQPENRTAV